jgi:hypothetical protein
MKEIMDKMMSQDSSAPDHDTAKLEVLEELREMAMKLMGDKMGGKMSPMQEVTVAAPDKAGLEQGLAAAQEIVPEMEASADDDMEMEEIEALIRELEDKKRAKMMQS